MVDLYGERFSASVSDMAEKQAATNWEVKSQQVPEGPSAQTEAASSEKVVSLETTPVGASTHLKMHFPDLLPTLPLKEVSCVLIILREVVQPSV